MNARRLAPLIFGFLSVQRLLELRLARANERWAREQGATEYGREHYPLFFLLHPGWMLGLLLEGRLRGRSDLRRAELMATLYPQAPEAQALYEDLSPPAPETAMARPAERPSGAGRPTKAERRATERLRSES